MPNCFNFVLKPRLPGRSVQSYEISFFSVFRHLDSFPHVFMQFKDSLILRLHEMKRLLHAVLCRILFFFCFMIKDWQGGVLGLKKIDHLLVLSAIWVLFPKFLGRLRSGLC